MGLLDIGKDFGDKFLALVNEKRWLVAGIGVTAGSVLWAVREWRRCPVPPGPPSYPLIGASYVLTGRLHEDFIKLAEKYGDVFSIKVPGGLIMVLNSYDAVKEAFVLSGADFNDRPNNKILHLMGFRDEIFFEPYNDVWKENKKFAMRALRNATSNDKIEQRILSEVTNLTKWLAKRSGQPVNLSSVVENCVANVVTGLVYNADYDLEDPECLYLISLVRGWFDTLSSYVPVIDLIPLAVSKMLFRRDIKRMASATQRAVEFISQKISEHRASFDANNLRDIIDEYLLGRPEDIDEHILSCTILIFLLDAIDTTANTLKWLLVYILNNPQVQDKMQTLLDKTTGKSRNVTLADRHQLAYIDAVILETFRLSNVVEFPGLHKPLKETTFRGYRVPYNTAIYANFYAIHRDSRLFPEPDRFLPEHFLDDEGNLSRSELCVTFGQGKRKCIGEHFVKKELFMFVSNIFSKYKFTCPPGEAPPSLTPDRKRAMMVAPCEFRVCVTLI